MLDAIPDDAVGRALKATMHYFATGEIRPLGPLERIAFAAFKVNVDEAVADYKKDVENGKRGGRPRKDLDEKPPLREANPPQPHQTEGEEEGDKDKEKEGEREDRDVDSHTFSPPSVKEVRAYCQEMGFGIDAERFVDYYTAIGWRIGATPIADWKAVVKNWNRKERKNGNIAADDKAEAGSLWPVIGTVV